MKKRFQALDEKEQKARHNEKYGKELEYAEDGNPATESSGKKATKGARLPELKGEDSITNRLVTWGYSKEQKDELRKALHAKMPMEDILFFFYPDTPVSEMKKATEQFMNQKKKKK